MLSFNLGSASPSFCDLWNFNGSWI